MIGTTYLKSFLKHKYQLIPEEVYLTERRQAINNSKVYLIKTANGVNLHSEIEKHWGNSEVKFLVCGLEED